MNILSLTTSTNNSRPAFSAKHPVVSRSKSIKQLVSDIVDVKRKAKVNLPKKIEFTEFEKFFNEIFLQLRNTEMNIMTQKRNLKDFYSSQDRYDYRDLLKKRQSIKAQLKRLAKQAEINTSELIFDLAAKKEYNRYAPKIFNAKSLEALLEFKNIINDSLLYTKTKKLLNKLIEQRKKELR